MANIGIVGLGSWGTALGQHLASNGHSVLGWARDSQVVSSINNQHQNAKYLKDAVLSPGLKATTSLSDLQSSDVVLLAFPSSKLTEILPQLNTSENTIILSAIKGFERQSLKTVSQFVSESALICKGICVLSGPSFAKDVVNLRPCGLVFASRQEEISKYCAELFDTPKMRVFTSTDILGVEIGGAVKNVIAIAAGACDGLGLGESARAGLITRGLAEIMRLAEALGANLKTLAGLSGLGDLIMTATSPTSRNYQVGFGLAQGKSLATVLSDIGTVAEGVNTAALVQQLAQKFSVRVSITDQVVKLLEGKSPSEIMVALLEKPVRSDNE